MANASADCGNAGSVHEPLGNEEKISLSLCEAISVRIRVIVQAEMVGLTVRLSK